MRRVLLVLASLCAATQLPPSSAATPQPSVAPLESLLLPVDFAHVAQLQALGTELQAFALRTANATVTVRLLAGQCFTGLQVSLPATFSTALAAALAAPPPDFPTAALVTGGSMEPDQIFKLQYFAPPATVDSSRGAAAAGAAAVDAAGAAAVDAAGETVQLIGSTQWHLARISSRSNTLDGTFVYSLDGAGVDIYIVDGGIATANLDFTGRIQPGFNAVGDQPADDVEDCVGHGTHVAGLAAGTIYGVAKAAAIVPVRVYGCTDSGPISHILVGLNWIMQRMAAYPDRRAIINMSFGGDKSRALDNAIQSLVGAGGVVVVAAGNSATDACAESPSGAPNAIAVGAIDAGAVFATFSNTGSCVAINAPGVEVTSDWVGSPTATKVLSGTSMSSPIAAGAVALILQAFPASDVATVRSTLQCSATLDMLTRVPPKTPNAIVYSPPTGFSETCDTPSPVRDTAGAPDGARMSPLALALSAALAVVLAMALDAGAASGSREATG